MTLRVGTMNKWRIDNALSTGCVPLNVLDLQSIEDLQRRDGVNDRQSIIRFFCYWILI